MASLSLQNLIHAIVGAVVEAQQQVQRFQIATLQGYFDEDDRPTSVDVRLPAMSSSAEEGEERILHVPLLALTGAHLLNIKEADVEFEVGLGVSETRNPSADKSGGDGKAAGDTARCHQLGVDMNSPMRRGAGTMAKVTLKVEASEPPDGVARLLQHLDKLI